MNNEWMKSRFLVAILVFAAFIIPIVTTVIATQIGWYFFGLVILVLTFFWVSHEFKTLGMETVSMVKAGFICLAMGVILAVVIAMGMTAGFYGLIAMPFILGSTYKLYL